MKTDIATVLDLGSTKVAALAATRGRGGDLQIECVGIADCKGVKRGVVVDLEATADAIGIALKKIESQIGQPVEQVTVGISGNHVDGTNAQGLVPIFPRSRTITREDVLQVINHSRQMMLPPDREQIQALPREFRVDGQRGIQRPVGMSGSKLEVTTYIVTGQTAHLQNIEKAVDMAGKKVEMMALQSLASGLAVLTPEEMELGCAVADIGGGSTDLAIFLGGSICHSASLPIGGALVTSDVSKLLKASPEEAERLKLESGLAFASLARDNETVEVTQLGQTMARPMQRRVLCEIIQSRMRELAVMVRQQIEKSGHYGVLPGGLVVTGGGSLLGGVDSLMEEELKHMRVRVAEPALRVGDAQNGHSLSTAVGLARYVLESGDDELGTATGGEHWKDRIRTFWSMISKN